MASGVAMHGLRATDPPIPTEVAPKMRPNPASAFARASTVAFWLPDLRNFRAAPERDPERSRMKASEWALNGPFGVSVAQKCATASEKAMWSWKQVTRGTRVSSPKGRKPRGTSVAERHTRRMRTHFGPCSHAGTMHSTPRDLFFRWGHPLATNPRPLESGLGDSGNQVRPPLPWVHA